MIDQAAYETLKKIPEYKTFRKKAKVRSIIMILILGLLWAAVLFPNNDQIAQTTMYILYGILGLFSWFAISSFVQAYFEKPKIVIWGPIEDVKKVYRTRDEFGSLRSTFHYEYKISLCDKVFWGESLYLYNNLSDQPLQVGEEAILFSLLGNYVVPIPKSKK